MRSRISYKMPRMADCAPSTDIPVTWKDIVALAKRVDAMWNARVGDGRRAQPACLSNKSYSSQEQGMPELCQDDTTPFTNTFEDFSNITVRQRFDFAYSPDQASQYMTGDARPICCAAFLVDGETSSTYVQPRYIGMNALTDQNIRNLIENDTSKIYKWWPEFKECVPMNQGVMADVYFITEGTSKCPCTGVHRVAHAVAGGVNGNGVNPANGQPYYPWTSVGMAATFTEPNWDKMQPEDGNGTYECPETGCCHTMVYPKLQQEVDASVNIFDPNIFLPNYPGAVTVPWSPASMASAIPAANVPQYAAASSYETWEICLEGATAVVQVTPLIFRMWNEAHASYDEQAFRVPTAVIVTLKGNYRPAIRKRWYDMLFYKLQFITGYVDYEGYVRGTSMNSVGEYSLANYDKPCSRYLALGYGWTAPAKYQPDGLLGEKTLVNMICARNYAGSALMCDGQESGDWNNCPGCFCTTSNSADSCQDLGCKERIRLPWDGACANDTCENSQHKTHHKTYTFLSDIISRVEAWKQSEGSFSLQNVSPWESCALDWKRGPMNLSLVFMNGSLSYESIPYGSYYYEDEECDGGGNTITCSRNNGLFTSVTARLTNDIPVAAGLVYATFLQRSNTPSRTLKITGSIGNALMPGNTYHLIKDASSPCARKDSWPDDKKEMILKDASGFNGGICTISIYYGPDGKVAPEPGTGVENPFFKPTMRSATPIILTRTSESDRSAFNLNKTINLPFNDFQDRYRMVLCIYVEIWGTGQDGAADNPWNIAWGKCFTPSQSSLVFTLS